MLKLHCSKNFSIFGLVTALHSKQHCSKSLALHSAHSCICPASFRSHGSTVIQAMSCALPREDRKLQTPEALAGLLMVCGRHLLMFGPPRRCSGHSSCIFHLALRSYSKRRGALADATVYSSPDYVLTNSLHILMCIACKSADLCQSLCFMLTCHVSVESNKAPQ